MATQEKHLCIHGYWRLDGVCQPAKYEALGNECVEPECPAAPADNGYRHLPMSTVWKLGNLETCRYCYQVFTVN